MEIAKTVFQKALGLMFREEVDMLFVFDEDVDFSVWTPFMGFSIDVFFLDEKGKAIEVKRDLAPWRFYRPKRLYRHFFEARAGKYKSLPKMVKKELN